MTLRHFIIPAYLVLCVLLGGASAAGYLSNLVLQLLALPIIVAALMKTRSNMSRAARALLWLTAAMIVLALIHLVPLPPGLWRSLPGRERVAEGFELLGQPVPWLPLSLKPERALAALLWLLPAFAALLGILRLGAYRAPYLAWALIAVTVAAVMVGAMQLTGGAQSPFYFYAVTNWGQGVGFFANSNHMATLLLCVIPFLAALHAEALGSGSQSSSKSLRRSSGIIVIIAGVGMIILVGLAINQSLAGIGLAVPVIGASILLVRYRRKALPAWAPVAGTLLTAAAVVAIFVAPLGSGAFSESARSSSESRGTSVAITGKAAVEHLPLGSGIGTFVDVYRTHEDHRTVEPPYMNHAHSDLAEIALETGAPGLLLVLLLLAWWGRRAWTIWGAGQQRPDHFARAATIATAAVIAHSLVDYPLRTAAISVLFAICLALMAEPRPVVRAAADRGDEGLRHLSA